MKRVDRVLLFLLLFAKTEGNEKETFIIDLLEKETFTNLVDLSEVLSVEFLPKNLDTLASYETFKKELSPYLDFQDKRQLARLYDDFKLIKEKKLIKDEKNNPDDYSDEMRRKIHLCENFSKERLPILNQEEPAFDVSLKDVLALDDLAEVILSQAEHLDEIIENKSESWTTDRMLTTDLALLRMGVYELSEMKANLANLVDDYVEIAKSYSGEESYKFINAILDAFYKEAINEY